VLPALSVYDNLLLARQSHASLVSLLRSTSRRALHESVVADLDRFRLLAQADRLAGTLSHGEQQWLEIAMAQATSPTVLLLDEPTAGMSLEERRLTGELLVPLKSRCAILIVEHDLDFIRDVCDVLTVLDQGSVLDSGDVETIQASRKVQEVYLTRV
jgi:branched-chain amino acid transport system ATP-binding protein